MQWHRLDTEKTESFLAAIAAMGGPSMFNAQNSEAKCMRLPFFENIQLYRITNHTSLPIFSMDFLGNGTDFFYLDGTEAPFQKAFSLCKPEINEINLASYLQFYFFNVLQEDGEIYPVFARSPIPDLDDQNIHATRQDVPDNAYVFDTQRKDENNFHAECTLFYDGGLMTGAMDISDQGHVEIVGLKPLFAGTKSVFSESSKDQMT